MVLSGGVSSFQNHYSQYLQTKLLAEHMRSRLTPEQVDLFFAAGNNETTKELFPDVHRYIQSSGLSRVDQLLPGIISGNRPATPTVVKEYFDTELPAKIDPSGTLFLLVTDHGAPNPRLIDATDPYADNCIDLWSGKATTRDNSLYEDLRNCFSVKKLEQGLKKSSPGRTVFAMTQCHSGGFHRLSVKKDGSSRWTANPAICGFTASDENTVASGCTSDVNDENYRGYERFFAEALSGTDVITRKPKGTPAKSLQEAHYSAAEIDTTLDIPLSTSEYFLRNWAEDIASSGFEPRTRVLNRRQAKKLLTQVMRNKIPREEILSKAGPFESWFAARFAHLDRMGENLAASSGTVGSLWNRPPKEIRDAFKGFRKSSLELETKKNEIEEQYAALIDEAMKPDYLNSLILKEKDPEYLKDLENRYHSFLVKDPDLYQTRLFSLTRAGNPDAVVLAEQEQKFLEIFAANAARLPGGKYENLPEQLDFLKETHDALEDRYSELSRVQHILTRIMIQRGVIAAAHVLIQMKDEQALADLQGLLECEATPF